MRRAPFTLLPVLITSLALTGCGGSDGSRDSVPGKARGAAPASLASVTDGRVGDAVTGTDAGSLRELSRGGRPDPSEPRGGKGRRDGVGAGDACTDTEILPAADTAGRLDSITLCLLNGIRADYGLPPLTTNSRLASAALRHAGDMVEKSYFAHEGKDGSTVRSRIGATGYIPSSGRWVIGENLAWGTGALATPKSIVNAWMNSPGHRANVLHAGYREIGFGIVLGNPSGQATGAGATYATTFGVVGESDAGAPSVPRRSTSPASSPSTRVAGKRQASKKAKKVKRSARGSKASRLKAKRARAALLRAKRASARS